MDRAVYLDHQCGGVTVEVNDETIDDLLASHVQATRAVPSQRIPEQRLGGVGATRNCLARSAFSACTIWPTTICLRGAGVRRVESVIESYLPSGEP